MTPAELDALAGKIAGHLRGPMVSTVLPDEIAALIRDAARHGSRLQIQAIHLGSGPDCLLADWTLIPDGTLLLKLGGPEGLIFWQGQFRPAEVDD